ncbi:cadherin repeat domain-containing protein [Porticoccaceae bacterium]|nr:cadherin repeat domain-containing protein [Porticoccaceae bacterium]
MSQQYIDENSGASQVIYTAVADDSLDTSAGVTFSLSSGSDAALSIDSATGAVTLSTDPDHETQSQYSFTVIASDGVNADVEQAVTLDINDLDEVAPTITSGDTATAIDENSGAGQVIYTAVADDSLDTSAGVTFSLSSGSDAALSIDSATGAVTLSTDPDHETQSQYSFTVIASDGVNTDVEQAVTLDINDLDEVAPTITSGDTATAIDENSGAGQVIYTAVADDSADVSGGVTFSLADDTLGFSIDANTGVVSTNDDFAADYENAQLQSFTVVATDASGNSSEQAVTLDINDLDEVAPTITSRQWQRL